MVVGSLEFVDLLFVLRTEKNSFFFRFRRIWMSLTTTIVENGSGSCGKNVASQRDTKTAAKKNMILHFNGELQNEKRLFFRQRILFLGAKRRKKVSL